MLHKVVRTASTTLKSMDNDKDTWEWNMEFFLNVSLNSLNSVTKIFVITVKGLEPTTSCVVRDHHSASKTHIRDRIFKFMPQWFITFPEFAEFTESSAHLGKTPIALIRWLSRHNHIPLLEYVW